MLNEADAVHGLEALGAAAAPELVVEMEAPSMVQHMGHVDGVGAVEWHRGYVGLFVSRRVYSAVLVIPQGRSN